MDKKEYIVCSMVYYDSGRKYVHMPINIGSGIAVCGLRHCNCLEIMREIFPDLQYKKNMKMGFLTSNNRFVDRKEGAEIAYNANQIDKMKETLFSEDLY